MPKKRAFLKRLEPILVSLNRIIHGEWYSWSRQRLGAGGDLTFERHTIGSELATTAAMFFFLA